MCRNRSLLLIPVSGFDDLLELMVLMVMLFEY